MTEQMENSMSVPYTKNYLTPTDACGKCLYIKSRCKCRKRETTMTENEAKEYLLNRYLVVGSPVNPPKEECEKHNAVIDMAIQALEKQSMVNEILNELQQYRAIGTVEELQALKEKSVAKKPLYKQGTRYKWIDCIRERGRYRNVEKYSNRDACPNCKKDVLRTPYCEECGQKLDWE